jgi:hypothetical protein
VVSQLTEHYGPTLFLGLHTATDTLARLRARDIPARLEQLGFADLHLVIGARTPEGQTLRVFDREPGPDQLLMEFKLRIDDLKPTLELVTRKPLASFRLLRIEWALFQNPRAQFTPERPRLPEQRYPGLGIGELAGTFLEDLAKEHHCDGLLSFPQHYHNAAIYSRRYTFFHPSHQGALEAMMRDLKKRTLADRSFAIDAGFLQKAGSDTHLGWEASEMVRPLSRHLGEMFGSRFWRHEARTARKASKWRIDWEAYDRKKSEKRG